MLSFIRYRQVKESGFSLIELMVAIMIMGILTAIAVPMYLNQKKVAIDATAYSDAKNAASQVETGVSNYPDTRCVELEGDKTEASTDKEPTEIFLYTNSGCTGSAETVTTILSEGNRMWISGDPYSELGYTIIVTNKNGSDDIENPGVKYVSNLGGIQ